MNEDNYPPETLELIYNEVKDALNTQFQSVEGLNTKASIIIGFVGVIIGISLNLYSDENSHLFIESMLLFLGAAFLSFFAYKVEGYRRDPEPRALTVNYLREDDKKLKKQLIDNFILSYEDNKKRIEKKVKYINYSIMLLFIGLILLTLSVIVG